MPKTSAKSKTTKRVKAEPAVKPPRMVKAPVYSSFKLQRKIGPTTKPLIGSFRLFGGSIKLLWRYRKPFLGIIAIYALLTFVLVKGLSLTSNLSSARDSLADTASSEVAGSAALFSYLLGAAGEGNGPSATLFTFILTIITSLALVWALRQAYADNIIRVRESFYKGMYPLVPYVMICCVIVLQVFPMALGLFLYNIVSTVSTTGVELFAWVSLLFLTTVLSLYMLTASFMALYVVSLPDMKPMQALRSARELVRHRRWTVLRKILFLPFALVIVGALIMMPFIIWLPTIAGLVFFGMSMSFLAVAHGYMYRLYRELI